MQGVGDVPQSNGTSITNHLKIVNEFIDDVSNKINEFYNKIPFDKSFPGLDAKISDLETDKKQITASLERHKSFQSGDLFDKSIEFLKSLTTVIATLACYPIMGAVAILVSFVAIPILIATDYTAENVFEYFLDDLGELLSTEYMFIENNLRFDKTQTKIKNYNDELTNIEDNILRHKIKLSNLNDEIKQFNELKSQVKSHGDILKKLSEEIKKEIPDTTKLNNTVKEINQYETKLNTLSNQLHSLLNGASAEVNVHAQEVNARAHNEFINRAWVMLK